MTPTTWAVASMSGTSARPSWCAFVVSFVRLERILGSALRQLSRNRGARSYYLCSPSALLLSVCSKDYLCSCSDPAWSAFWAFSSKVAAPRLLDALNRLSQGLVDYTDLAGALRRNGRSAYRYVSRVF